MAAAENDYIFTEVMTASPQKLQLMLIEAAIRFANLGRHYWAAGRADAACHSIIRSQAAVAEMIGVLNPNDSDPVIHRVLGVYTFIYRTLIEANLERNEAKLDDALRVLYIERDTWRMVCNQTAAAAPQLDYETSGGSSQFVA